MLDKKVVKNFLMENLKGVKIPKDISVNDLTETFCKYTENDYYEWLKDNFKSFFEFKNGKVDWKWIKERIKDYK